MDPTTLPEHKELEFHVPTPTTATISLILLSSKKEVPLLDRLEMESLLFQGGCWCIDRLKKAHVLCEKYSPLLNLQQMEGQNYFPSIPFSTRIKGELERPTYRTAIVAMCILSESKCFDVKDSHKIHASKINQEEGVWTRERIERATKLLIFHRKALNLIEDDTGIHFSSIPWKMEIKKNVFEILTTQRAKESKTEVMIEPRSLSFTAFMKEECTPTPPPTHLCSGDLVTSFWTKAMWVTKSCAKEALIAVSNFQPPSKVGVAHQNEMKSLLEKWDSTTAHSSAILLLYRHARDVLIQKVDGEFKSLVPLEFCPPPTTESQRALVSPNKRLLQPQNPELERKTKQMKMTLKKAPKTVDSKKTPTPFPKVTDLME